jgi:hypothetical protein
MLKRSLESLVAGICVYAAMAACSGGGGPGATKQAGDAGGPVVLEGGQPATGGAPHQADGAGMSNAGSPVPNAMAAGGGEGDCGCAPVEPKEPTMVESECDVEVAGSPSLWAIAEFPGKTALELARVVPLIEYPEAARVSYKWPTGFVSQVSNVLVQDGSVAVACGSQTVPSLTAVRVRFVLP